MHIYKVSSKSKNRNCMAESVLLECNLQLRSLVLIWQAETFW